MRKKTILIFSISLILALSAITFYRPLENKEGLSQNAINYIEQRGYKIVGYEGEVERVLLGEKLRYDDMEFFYINDIDPADYIGKTLTYERILVTNHPLDNDLDRLKENIHWFPTHYHPNETRIVLIKDQDQIIGAESFKVIRGPALLGFEIRDIDGLSLKDKCGENYSHIQEDLSKKFTQLRGY